MEDNKNSIQTLLKQATGTSSVLSTDFKSIDNISQEKVEFSRVRGNIRLMSGKIKTPKDVDKMVESFLSLRVP